MAPTVNINTTLTTSVRGYEFLPNGDFLLVFDLIRPDLSIVRGHRYLIKADGSAALDEFQVALGTPPAGLITALTNLKTQTDNILAAAIAAGKVAT